MHCERSEGRSAPVNAQVTAPAALRELASPAPQSQERTQQRVWPAGGRVRAQRGAPGRKRQCEDDHLETRIFVGKAGARKHEDGMDCIQRFGKQVLPEFKERHKEHEKWRAEQLRDVEYPINSSI